MNVSQPFKCPRIVGNYELIKCLGNGAFGYVYQAISSISPDPIAIKVIPKKNVKSVSDQQRLQREIEATAFLHHPNIVQLHDFFTDNFNFYLVMDYCSGGSLNSYIKNRSNPKLREDQAATIFAQIVSGISYCHDRGVGHRDLKPHNVLITKFPEIKICDFGLCGYFEEGQKMDTFCGTECYNAPELFSKAQYDVRKSDVWSLGVILYVMVTGNSPWNQNTPHMIQQIQSADFYIPDEISEDCQDLIKRMMITTPNDRIKLDEVLSHPFLEKASSSNLKMPARIAVPKGQPTLPRLSGFTLKEISDIARNDAQSKDSSHGIVSPFEAYKEDTEEESEEIPLSSSFKRKSLPSFTLKSQSIEHLADQQKGAKRLVFQKVNSQTFGKQRQKSTATLLNRSMQLPPLQNPRSRF